MTSISRGLKAVLAGAFLWPVIGLASPIYAPEPDGTPFLAGWANSAGNFEFVSLGDDAPQNHGSSKQNSYSTASSLFSYEGVTVFEFNSSGKFTPPADVQIDAIIKGNGTASGDLLSGILTVRAGPQGIPELGAAAGDILMVGNAIDSAASALPSLIAFLFEMTYEAPQLSGYGGYVTFYGNLNRGGTCIPPCSVITPWGVDFSNLANFTFDALLATRKVPEPASYALTFLALGALGLATRRRKGAQS